MITNVLGQILFAHYANKLLYIFIISKTPNMEAAAMGSTAHIQPTTVNLPLPLINSRALVDHYRGGTPGHPVLVVQLRDREPRPWVREGGTHSRKGY